MENHGINWELEKAQQKETDWVFGSASPKCIALIPNGERDLYLPKGEIQRGKEDTLDCASRAPVNLLETKFNYLLRNGLLPKTHSDWLIDNGYVTVHGVEFSDAFIAITSKSTRQGNSLIAPCDAIHNFGLIPKKILPLVPTMTWDEYHNPERITPAMYDLGKRFLERFNINYERVLEKDYGTLLEQDILDVGGFAWPEPVNGVYEPIDLNPNHAFIVYKAPKYFAFDNYPDSFDGDFVKKLSPNYDLIDWGYRLFISINQSVSAKQTFWQRFLNWWKGRFIKTNK